VNVSDDNMIRYDAENRNIEDVLFTRDDIKYETVLAMKLKSNCWYVAIKVREKLYKL